MRRLFLLLLTLCLFAAPAYAHKPSDSYLYLSVAKDGTIQGQWDVALRDLDYAIGIDENNDNAITWGELVKRQAAIAAYILPKLNITAGAAICTSTVIDHLVDNHTDGAYEVLRFVAHCPKEPSVLELDYRLFADLDPQHRGLLRLDYQGQTRTAIFGPNQAKQRFELGILTPWRQFRDFAREGIWHIWIGFDHILFLIALLLPSVLLRKRAGDIPCRPLEVGTFTASPALNIPRRELQTGQWEAVAAFRPAFWNVLKIVTAFTLAHSITLSLAALEVINLPSRLVESTIAASIVIGALNNIYPLVINRLWVVAFLFGLVHGFGFASVLVDLGLPQGSLLLALVGFNVGVEIGQLAIVAVFLPLAFGLRRSWLYQRIVLVPGSVVIALVALTWMLERIFNFKVLPF
ncbi:MAG: HupE/UreJ family protein [Gammaproteobacteria bacterium]